MFALVTCGHPNLAPSRIANRVNLRPFPDTSSNFSSIGTLQRIARTTEAISTIHKSWKPSECDQRSGLQRLVGDFVYEDHLFIDLMINHHVRSHDPRLVLSFRYVR